MCPDIFYTLVDTQIPKSLPAAIIIYNYYYIHLYYVGNHD